MARKKSRFRRMTPQQRSTYAAIRALGSMMITPQDARPLRALQRRGLIRYARSELGRIAILRENKAQQRARRRRRPPRWFGWPNWNPA